MKQLNVTHATLPQLLRLLVENGSRALLSAEGIESVADSLAYGHLTVWPNEQGRYGGEREWKAWERLRKSHGNTLRSMAARYAKRIGQENERKAEKSQLQSRSSTGKDYFGEGGKRRRARPAMTTKRRGLSKDIAEVRRLLRR